MKRFIILMMGLLIIFSGTAVAQDMRAMHVEAEKKKARLLEKARLEEKAARQEARESKERIFSDRKRLKQSIAELRADNSAIEKEIDRLGKDLVSLRKEETELRETLAEKEAEVKELVGFIRVNARDLEGILKLSPQSAFYPDRQKALRPLITETRFPGMDDISKMVDLIFDEVRYSGEVKVLDGPIVNRAGEETTAEVLFLGNFTAAYRLKDETGFLIYSDQSQRLFALSKLPSASVRSKLEAYMDGESIDVPVDMSKGAALRQLSHQLNYWEQIPEGGPIVYPIIGILALAVLIILERVFYLFFKSVNAEKFTGEVCALAGKEDWKNCTRICEAMKGKSIPKVLLEGIRFREMSRQDLENVLQEAILNEVPKLERFLSTLGMLAAIAPLLGLLGTVTGMINTFNVITYFGTGDPRMMSGGISEALITTMLGLTVAIPIMLSHTLLSRKVETMISQMEEKAVAFVNTLYKDQNCRP